MPRLLRIFLPMLISITALSTVPAQASGLDDLERGIDRPGWDYDNFHARKVKKCVKACRKDERCRAFSYDRDMERCWLKTRVSHAEQIPGMVSGVKRRGGRHGGGKSGGHHNTVNGVTIERDSDRMGSDYDHLQTNNAESCARECGYQRRCRAFAYNIYQRLCWLKDQVPQRRHFAGSVSGVKRGNDNHGGSHHNKPDWSNVEIPPYPPRMKIEAHTDRMGSDYRQEYAPHAAICANLCAQERRCRAFSFNKDLNKCWLKDSVPPATRYEPSVSGVK